jgi:hypothetical protein
VHILNAAPDDDLIRQAKKLFQEHAGRNYDGLEVGPQSICLPPAFGRRAAEPLRLVPTIGGGGVVIQGWDEHSGSDSDRPDGAGAV